MLHKAKSALELGASFHKQRNGRRSCSGLADQLAEKWRISHNFKTQI
jgi:hypothetical protein